MGLFDRLFGKKPLKKRPNKVRFDFLIYDDEEPIEPNCWYQKASWNNKNFVRYDGFWDSDWKWSDEGKVKVVGVSHGDRSDDFIYLAREKDFKMFLEDEPDNPANEHARKVMASALPFGGLMHLRARDPLRSSATTQTSLHQVRT